VPSRLALTPARGIIGSEPPNRHHSTTLLEIVSVREPSNE
jgi:hypothetical protein